MPSPRMMKQLLLIVAFFAFSTFIIAQESDLSDEDSPEITARVARVSFIRGDAQVKRAGEQDWESVSLNLPLVEGDQISTSENSRVEIQFDSQKFLRLAENSSLKITTLRDEGIALTMPQGTLSLRVFELEKEQGFFEIDVPQTTVAVQETGLYRIDAPGNEDEVRVTITDGGQARIYSDNSGFTLRDGRSAKIFLSTDRLGEWETADASNYSDEWDSWVAERDNKLSDLLNNAKNDQYYDQDIYGAEDLNDYGSWSDSSDYGKIWRPNYSSISSYSNWSPYRYGSWRWVNPYGWVWVNDEPWGWATYHYGRWDYDNRGWFWTPRSYYQPKRNYWRPAIVSIFNVGNDVCWSPLTYRDRYKDYNRYYRQGNSRGFGRNNNQNYQQRDYGRLPANTIVAVRSDEFGRRRANPRSISYQTIQQNRERNLNQEIQLPKAEERKQEFRRNPNFRQNQTINQIRTGVTERQAGVELDRTLRNERFRNNRQQPERIRQPVTSSNQIQNTTENNNSRRNERVERRNQDSTNSTSQPTRQIILPPYSRPSSNNNQTNNGNNSERRNNEQQRNNEQRPSNNPQNNSPENRRIIVKVPENNSMENNQRSRERNNNSNDSNQRSRSRETQNDQNNGRRDNPPENRPVYVPRNNDQNQRSAGPRSENPQPRVERREEPRREQPRQEQRREQPRQESPRVERREQPRQEQPRQEQRREQPRQEQPRVETRREQPRQEQPRQKEAPKEERRYTPPPKSETKRIKPNDN